MSDLRRLDDEDYPAYTTGQAAELLGVQQAFLRSLDSAGVVSPHRSTGGHRRYSRKQLAIVLRLRRLFDAGHTLASADRIVGLQDELEAARAEISVLRLRLSEAADDGEVDKVDGTVDRDADDGARRRPRTG